MVSLSVVSQLPVVNHGLKILNGNTISKEFREILNCMPFCKGGNLYMPCSILPGHQLSLHPVYPYLSLLWDYAMVLQCLYSSHPLFYLLVVSKLKRGDTGNSDMSKRSYKVLSLSEMMLILSLIRKKRYSSG